MIKISSGNPAFDLGFMHEMREQGWTKKQASVILDYMLQHGSLDAMEKSASAGLVYDDPEANPLFFLKWAASAQERYAWCNSPMRKFAAMGAMSDLRGVGGSDVGGLQVGQQMQQQNMGDPTMAGIQGGQQGAPTTGSVEGDMQAGQQAAKSGGGFFSKLWNGVKSTAKTLAPLALSAVNPVMGATGMALGDKLGSGIGRLFGGGKS